MKASHRIWSKGSVVWQHRLAGVNIEDLHAADGLHSLLWTVGTWGKRLQMLELSLAQEN